MPRETVDNELIELRARITELDALLQALRSGAADALIGEDGVLPLDGAAKPYVTFFSVMNEGGVTLDRRGAVLHGNPRFAAMVGQSIDELRGKPFGDFVAGPDRERAAALIREAQVGSCEVGLAAPGGEALPVRLSLKAVQTGSEQFCCLVVTELRERIESERELRTVYAHQQAAIEAERKRVAREVHDEMGQILTALRMELSLLQRELPSPEKDAPRFDEMFHLIESLFRSVRSIAGSLRPSTLDLGLVPAIEWLAQDFEKRWNIECALDMGVRNIDVGEDYATTVFRVIQESLTNVARHAQATSVSIVLDRHPDGIHLEIQDDGRGFDPATAGRGRFGMTGMRERVQELGGTLAVRGGAGCGTQIVIDLPFPGARK